MAKSFQGISQHTPRKEFEIEGLSFMRMTQFKNHFFLKNYSKIIIADIFSGTGVNEIQGRVIDGSPIKILNALHRAQNPKSKKSIPWQMPVDFWFSDIRKVACESLRNLISTKYNVNPETHAVSASDALNILGEILFKEPRTYLYLVIDPNGPKDFPLGELNDLCRSFSTRIDIVAYISATSINRCIGARNKAGIDFKGYLGEISNFKKGFVEPMTQDGRQGWIREPIEKDPQRWLMLPTFGRMFPRNDWSKQGYVDIKSKAGRHAINHYCGGFINE